MKPYEIEWVDSHGWPGWSTEEEMKYCCNANITCKSVGYVFKKMDDRIILVSSESVQGSFQDVLAIPRVAIKKTRRLK